MVYSSGGSMEVKHEPLLYEITFWCNYGNHLVTYKREAGNGPLGYAHPSAHTPERICYECCAKQDVALMKADGRYTLYLGNQEVTNWPGTLRFKLTDMNTGRHNIAGKRYDVWFDGPDGHVWHGVTYGDNTQICHVHRTKK